MKSGKYLEAVNYFKLGHQFWSLNSDTILTLDSMGSTTFAPVKMDIQGNINVSDSIACLTSR